MGIGKTRGLLYWLARLLGDLSAVQKGRMGRRVGRRLAWQDDGQGVEKAV